MFKEYIKKNEIGGCAVRCSGRRAAVLRGPPSFGAVCFSSAAQPVGLGGVGGVVLRGLDFRSIRYVSSIVGTVRGGRLFATFRRAGWCSGAGGSLGGGFPRGGGLRLAGAGGIVTLTL